MNPTLTASLTAADLVAVVVSVLALATVGALVLVLTRLVRTQQELRETLVVLREETLPLVDELHRTVAQAEFELTRVDDLVGTAEAISARVEGASRIASAALSRPVIRTVAVATGTSRAAKRLRRGS